MNYSFKHLSPADVPLMKKLLKVFGDAFHEIDTYQSAIPSDEYLKSLLAKDTFIALVATDPAAADANEEVVVGGLVAYVLEKFEQDRREIYIYDLAVAEPHRRKGIARQLIKNLQGIAKQLKAYVIFVQADYGDDPAIALYESMGVREEVLHFDIPVE
jgi:aminoglycoside 3-N-acetyltransferase I